MPDVNGINLATINALRARLGVDPSTSPYIYGAKGDGVTDDTDAISDWLQAMSADRRIGRVPAGDFLVRGIQLIGLDYMHVEAHPEARFIGAKSYQNFSGNGTTGQSFTVTDFTLTFGTLRAAQITSGGVQIPLTEGTHFSISGLTVTMLGANTIPVGDSIRIVSSEPMLEIRGAGTGSARSGRFSWEGGFFDVNERGVVSSQASGSGLTILYYGKYDVHGTHFYGADDYQAGDTKGVADSGLTALYCDNGSVSANVFQGFGDLGIYATGGELSTPEDDGCGLSIYGNHFVKCVAGWKAARQLRNVVAHGNTYDRCWIGAALWPASNIVAGRGSITGEVFRRCGRNAIDVRLQVGSVIANNTIIDPGYLLDGTTLADTYAGGGAIAAIALGGCRATNVANNVIRMDDLAPIASSYGIRNVSLTFESVTYQPTDNIVTDNNIHGQNIGVQESGSGTGSRYRTNTFRSCTTEYDVPAAHAPYGTWTPAITNTANVSASTLVAARYRRLDGNYIDCDVVVNIDINAAGTPCEIRFPPPMPVASSSADEIIGMGASDVVALAGRVYSTGTDVRFLFRPPTGADVGNRAWALRFTYKAANG